MLESQGRKRAILVTGAGGFVGGFVCALLEERARTEPFAIQAAAFDLTDRDATHDAVASLLPDAVIHLAAIAAPREANADARRAWDVNFTGTMNLAEAVKRHTPKARFIHVGSSEAYGASFAGANAPLTEDAALKPVNTYGATKAAADILIGQMSYDGLNAIRFRPFNHTGPGQLDAYVVPAFARQIAEIIVNDAAPVIRVGNLEAQRDFLDVRDVARAYVDAALATGEVAPGTVYNLATGQARSIRSLLDALIAASGRAIEIEPDPARMRPNDLPVAAGDNKAVADGLGWSPRIPIETTLADVLMDWKRRVGLPVGA